MDWDKYIDFRDDKKYGEFNKNINPEFLGRLAQMAKYYGIKLEIGYGYRTNEMQASFGNSNKAAKAGTSWHEYGLAVDVKNKEFRNLIEKGDLEKFGLTRDAKQKDGKWEWWHITPIETRGIKGQDRKDWAYKNAYYDGIE